MPKPPRAGKPKPTTGKPSTPPPPEWKGDLASPDKLLLDPQNPRLAELKLGNPSQEELIETLWTEMAVEEVAMSIAASGFFPNEPLYVEERPDGSLVVIEGNRRLAAVKLLRSESLRKRVKATDLPTPSPEHLATLAKLPIVKTTRKQFWPFEGFKHVNGAAPWRSYDKAAYIQLVHEQFGVPLDDIAKRIGDRHATVRRLYRGLKVLEQAEKAKLFKREDRADKRFFFSHLYTGLDKPGIQAFVGLDATKELSDKPVSNTSHLKELMTWVFGSSGRKIPSLIESQNPDLAILDEVLQSKEGLTALRRGETLRNAADIAKGDPRLFVEALQAARLALQQARAKVFDGYAGDDETFESVKNLRKLASMLIADMENAREEPRPAVGRGKGTKA